MLFSLSQYLSLPVHGDYFVSWLTECFVSHPPDLPPRECLEGRKDLMDNLAWSTTSPASFWPALPNTFLPKGPQEQQNLLSKGTLDSTMTFPYSMLDLPTVTSLVPQFP